MRKLKDLPISDFKFDEFLVDKSNIQAVNVVNNWIVKAQCGYCEPLAIFGSVGVGKTHLAVAAMNELKKYRKNVEVYIFSFQRQFDLSQVPVNSFLLLKSTELLFVPLIDSVLEQCQEKNISIIILNATESKYLEIIESVWILDPDLEFMKTLARHFLKGYPEIQIDVTTCSSLRHLEMECRRAKFRTHKA